MNHLPSPPRRRQIGFTLVEMAIATAVSGLLASVAYPSVSAALHKARRSEAMVAMMQLQQAQERWRSGNSRYASLPELGLAANAPGGHYRIEVADPGPQGYVALAQATGAQAGDRACRYLVLVVDGAAVTYRSGDSQAASNDTTANRQCWNL